MLGSGKILFWTRSLRLIEEPYCGQSTSNCVGMCSLVTRHSLSLRYVRQPFRFGWCRSSCCNSPNPFLIFDIRARHNGVKVSHCRPNRYAAATGFPGFPHFSTDTGVVIMQPWYLRALYRSCFILWVNAGLLPASLIDRNTARDGWRLCDSAVAFGVAHRSSM